MKSNNREKLQNMNGIKRNVPSSYQQCQLPPLPEPLLFLLYRLSAAIAVNVIEIYVSFLFYSFKRCNIKSNLKKITPTDNNDVLGYICVYAYTPKLC